MFTTFRNFSLPLLTLLVLMCAVPPPAAPGPGGQRSFTSPEEAVKSLAAAVKDQDARELLAVLGPDAKEIITSGDPVADKAARKKFMERCDENIVIAGSDSGKATVTIGSDDYPLPIPVVKSGDGWRFDTRAGKEELLSRRIGKNELEVIDVLHAYVDAQREYVAKDRDGNGAVEFAQKIRSTPGRKDGLYWPAKVGEEESPFGPLAAQAAQEGYSATTSAKPSPYHGYLFNVLKSQGKNADGGAYSYMVNGRMILGFALVAYPARYGSSGIMTFIVNQNGIVYQKNLGKNTGKIAAAMKIYNPDKSWQKVD